MPESSKSINETMKTNRKFDSFSYDANQQIVAIHGRTLEVKELSEKGEAYFQAWVDGYQNDGLSHNEAVVNALNFAQQNKRSQ
ncbi:hypothetical protein AB6D66_00595 [Vibrio pomeroyi]|uniref:Uncharacterized protein n=1 Tax=Vibrio pomeroyi TaxID=198832 RepID=A0ABV4MQX1_9VIBR|nr:hypothetical protein [Vibrio atlanticus]MCZ4311048.1 hypothetical protein [Vibrio atlanticus]